MRGPGFEQAYGSTVGRAKLALSSLEPVDCRTERGAEAAARVLELARTRHYDCVWYATARTAVPLGHLPLPSILDGDDFSFMRNYQLLRSSSWYGAKIFDYMDVAKYWWLERNLQRHHTVVLRCSEVDRRRFLAPNVEILPNGTIIPDHVDRRPMGRVLFVGDLGYAPNRHGLEWFLGSVWPRIRASNSDASLDIVGRLPSDRIRSFGCQDGVHVHGFVDNLETLYESASLSIVPLLAGGGTRLKIIESLARIVPVVSTEIGATGLEIPAGSGLDIADGADAFAIACLKILGQGAQADAAAVRGREYVARHYDWKLIQDKAMQLVARVSRRMPGRYVAPRVALEGSSTEE